VVSRHVGEEAADCDVQRASSRHSLVKRTRLTTSSEMDHIARLVLFECLSRLLKVADGGSASPSSDSEQRRNIMPLTRRPAPRYLDSPQVRILGTEEHPFLALLRPVSTAPRLGVDNMLKRRADESGAWRSQWEIDVKPASRSSS
jgi:hypothetical protein